MDPLLLATLGLSAGLFGAILGVGGGVILVPALVLLVGFPLPDAVGTSLVAITGTSLVGTLGYLRQRLVEVDLAFDLEVGALGGALAAAWMAPLLPEALIAAVFSLVLVLSAVRLWRAPPEIAPEHSPDPSRRYQTLALTPVVGGAAGLLGVGGGILLVPLLRLLLRLDMRRAVATSTFTVGMTASVAAMVYLRRGEVHHTAVPALLLGIFLGAAIAPWVGRLLPRRGLEIVFSLLLVYLAARMVWP